MRATAFEHPVYSVELIETHISWVIAAGDFVYKIKKPVKLDFLDFHELEQRRFFCEEELRLNRSWAPDIYLDVVPVTIEGGLPRFGGEGEPVEYAVRMRRFDQEGLLDRQLEQGSLTAADMQELGTHIAERHLAAPVIDAGQRHRLIPLNRKFIRDNFTALDGVIDPDELARLRDWTDRELENLDKEMSRRFGAGFTRDCHGDLHLANLVRLPRGITAFDCIEFSADLRHIDVFCDIAFLLMDLVARRRHDLAAQFLNRYLERTGDYDGMAVFSLYFVYRCLVRAKVAAIRSREQPDSAPAHQELLFYCDMARRQIAPRVPILTIMSGTSGSGKTWVSTRLLAAMPAVRIRSDVERKRLFELGETEDSHSGIGQGIYAPQATRALYDHVLGTARSVLAAGHNVILDAAFLHSAEREAAVDIARRCAAVPVILVVSAPLAVKRERIRARARRADDASEAGLCVLEHQLANAEPVAAEGGALVMRTENVGDIDVAAIAAEIKRAAKTAQTAS